LRDRHHTTPGLRGELILPSSPRRGGARSATGWWEPARGGVARAVRRGGGSLPEEGWRPALTLPSPASGRGTSVSVATGWVPPLLPEEGCPAGAGWWEPARGGVPAHPTPALRATPPSKGRESRRFVRQLRVIESRLRSTSSARSSWQSAAASGRAAALFADCGRAPVAASGAVAVRGAHSAASSCSTASFRGLSRATGRTPAPAGASRSG